MTRLLLQADAVLRGRHRGPATSAPSLRLLLGLIVAFGLAYGGVMGTFGGVSGERAWQVFYSAAKVPLLLLATFVLSLPSFFVLNTILGLRDDFPQVLRALTATQAGLTIILASLAPLTILWYLSSADYQAAILFNGLMFGVASVSAQWLLRRDYRPLILRVPRHRWMLRLWLVIYAFVGIQMGWVLRPFVGDPVARVQFFRQESWGNAYVVVLRMIWDQLLAR
jgi:hypothetical protein